MNISESIILAFDSIRVNKLRATLTLLSISIGVFAIIGAGSLVTSINTAVSSEMEAMGESAFMIFKMPVIQTGHTWRKYRNRKPITFSQVQDLKRQLKSTDRVCAISKSEGFTLQNGNFETDPDVNLVGTDENYFIMNNLPISDGRSITVEDINFNRNVVVIGNDIVVKCFPNEDPLGKEIKIKNQRYTVIGIQGIKGALLGQSQDNTAVIPVTQFLTYFADEWEESLIIQVQAKNMDLLSSTMDETIGILRSIRNVKPWEENSFELETNQSITEQFEGFTGFLSYFGLFSGAIALIAAGVGIMNIMLVSVKERTREIGIRKAVGAKKHWILFQFIIETITLCQVGGFFGIILGIGASFFLGSALGIKLTLPIDWIIISITICTFLGIVSGAYPAWRAAKLDPIDALRYE